MIYGFISSLDGETTKAFFRSKRIPANNIYSAGGLGALVEDLKTGDVVYTISCNRFASVRQVYTFARFCADRGIILHFVAESYLDIGNGKTWRPAVASTITMTYTYDACQRLKEECITSAEGKVLAKYAYGIGKAGERTSITEVDEKGIETETTYKYDKLERLVKEIIERDGNKLINEYTYDKVSNRIAKETTVKGDVTVLADTNLDEIEIIEGKTTYVYNALNQLLSEQSAGRTITYTYDVNGNLIKQSGNKNIDYSYDKENHLLKATIQQGNSITIESYTYDYEGNRTSKTINDNDKTLYVVDSSSGLSQVVAETDETGKEIASYTLGEERISVERAGEVCYYLYDGHGSVRILTNEAGRITDRYAYNAYGCLLEKDGDSENEFLYTGEQYNANTGLYYLRARYMNPSTGTFISMDSYQGSIYEPVTLHKYLYANANPVKYTDPSGYNGKAETLLVAATAIIMIGSAMVFNNQVPLNTFSAFRRNMIAL